MRQLCLAFLWVFGSGLAVAQNNTELSEPEYREASECIEDRDAFMSLDYWTFDQDPTQGVQSIVSKPGCELVAADLISDFHLALREKSEPVILDHPAGQITISETGEITILYWHEGQIRAFENQKVAAIELFELSLKPEDQNNRGWNEYVRASIAFLQDDLDELQTQRTLMAQSDRPSALNLGVVDSLIACFGRTYSEAYSMPDCNRRPGFQERAAEN